MRHAAPSLGPDRCPDAVAVCAVRSPVVAMEARLNQRVNQTVAALEARLAAQQAELDEVKKQAASPPAAGGAGAQRWQL